jgi:hypothetical protein
MAEATLTTSSGTARVTALSLIAPRVGMWTADVTLDADAGPDGGCTLTLDGVSWAGGVVRGAVVNGVWRGRLAGAPALLGTAPATALRGATLALVLRELAGALGLGLATDLGALDAAAPAWHRHEGQGSQAVADIARAAGYAWRVRADGRVWMGPEVWPTFTPASPVDVVDELAEAGRLTLAGDTLGILPGQTLALRGRAPVRVGVVEHRATADDLQTVVIAEPAPTERGGLLEAFERLLGRLIRRVDYLGLYPARVVAQRADGTLDLVPDSPRVAPCQGVPYRTLRGLSVEVSAGARVLLGYEGGEPSRPYALAWEIGDATSVRVNGGTRSAARDGDSVSVTIPAGAVLVSSPGGPIPSPAPITLSGTITSGTTALRLP